MKYPNYIDFVNWTTDHLRKELKRQIKNANRNIKNLYDKGYFNTSNANRYIQNYLKDNGIEKNGIFLFKYSNKLKRNDLIKMLVKTSGFLNSKTSNIRGVKKSLSQMEKNFYKQFNKKLTDSEKKNLFKVYNENKGKLVDMFKSSEQILGVLMTRIQNETVEKLNEIIDKLDNNDLAYAEYLFTRNGTITWDELRKEKDRNYDFKN